MSRLSRAFKRLYISLAIPSSRKFFIALGLLWILNAADVWQTLALKSSGHLASEANKFIEHVLSKGPIYFILFKILAVFFISLVIIRGFFDKRGIQVGETRYSHEQVRTSIQLLLMLGIIYYLFVVYLPFIIVFATFQA